MDKPSAFVRKKPVNLKKYIPFFLIAVIFLITVLTIKKINQPEPPQPIPLTPQTQIKLTSSTVTNALKHIDVEITTASQDFKKELEELNNFDPQKDALPKSTPSASVSQDTSILKQEIAAQIQERQDILSQIKKKTNDDRLLSFGNRSVILSEIQKAENQLLDIEKKTPQAQNDYLVKAKSYDIPKIKVYSSVTPKLTLFITFLHMQSLSSILAGFSIRMDTYAKETQVSNQDPSVLLEFIKTINAKLDAVDAAIRSMKLSTINIGTNSNDPQEAVEASAKEAARLISDFETIQKEVENLRKVIAPEATPSSQPLIPTKQ